MKKLKSVKEAGKDDVMGEIKQPWGELIIEEVYLLRLFHCTREKRRELLAG